MAKGNENLGKKEKKKEKKEKKEKKGKKARKEPIQAKGSVWSFLLAAFVPVLDSS